MSDQSVEIPESVRRMRLTVGVLLVPVALLVIVLLLRSLLQTISAF